MVKVYFVSKGVVLIYIKNNYIIIKNYDMNCRLKKCQVSAAKVVRWTGFIEQTNMVQYILKRMKKLYVGNTKFFFCTEMVFMNCSLTIVIDLLLKTNNEIATNT